MWKLPDIQIPMSMSKALLEISYVHLFTYWLE